MLRLVFILATVLWTALSLGLSLRQIAHVRRHRDVVPVDFAPAVSLPDHRRAADYTAARERLAMVETVVGALVAVAWVTGGVDGLHGLLAGVLAPGTGLELAFLLATGVVGAAVALPFEVWRAFRIEARFGFNRRSPALFLADKLKGWAIALVVAAPLILAALWAMRVASGLWWLWAWVGLVALMVAAPAVYVRVIAPRFNTFTPLEGELRARIERLLAGAGFTASGLFAMDASRRSAHGNAYFIGFGRAKRIVLFDTLLDTSPPDEIEAVIAHELGHFRHRHVLFGLARAALMALGTLAAFGWLCRQPWLLPSFGIGAEGDGVRLFACLLLGSVVGPLLAPLSNWISRRNEYQADDYARRTVGAAPMVGALTRLARDNASTLTPDPLYALAHHTHPPVPLRVARLRAGEARAA